jgi:hypothetical protein
MLSKATYLRSIRRPDSGRVSYVVLDQQLSDPLQPALND